MKCESHLRVKTDEVGLEIMFLDAVANNDEISIRYLLTQKNVYVDCWNGSGLSLACENNSYQIVCLLLAFGACVEQQEESLTAAIKNQRYDIVKELVKRGCWCTDILLAAINNGDYHLFKLLLDNKKTKLSQDEAEDALVEATANGQKRMVSLLLQKTHIDPRVTLNGVLQQAQEKGYNDLVDYLELACFCTELTGNH